jgi:rare lipoprotein A
VVGLLGVSSMAPGRAICGVGAATAQTTPAPAPAAPAKGHLSGAVGEIQTGLASYYGQRFHGRRTASGQRLDNDAMTTAHRTLPFGTKVRVTNVKTGQSAVLRVNDRGPAQPHRILDVSRAAAQQLGFIRAGRTEVKLEVIEAANPPSPGLAS